MSKRKLEDTDLETDHSTNPKQPKYQDQKPPHKQRTELESKDKATKTRDTPRKKKHSEKLVEQKTPEKDHTVSETTSTRETPTKAKHSEEEVRRKSSEKGYTQSETVTTKPRDTPTKTKHSKEEIKQKSPEKANTESETDNQATEIKQPEETLKSKSPRKLLKRYTESEIKDHKEKERQKTSQKGKGTTKSKKAKPPCMKVTSKFVFFYRAENVFSQFHPAKFVVDGQQYNCMEQYMHHQKAVIFKDGIRAKEILKATDPLTQKKLGRKVENFDKDVWHHKSLVVVKYGNEHKYLQNPEMKKLLFDTYPRTLVEASPRDRLWGIGMGANNENAENPEKWRGKNLLGYCLTAVRDKLMKEEGLIPKEGDKRMKEEGLIPKQGD